MIKTWKKITAFTSSSRLLFRKVLVYVYEYTYDNTINMIDSSAIKSEQSCKYVRENDVVKEIVIYLHNTHSSLHVIIIPLFQRCSARTII